MYQKYGTRNFVILEPSFKTQNLEYENSHIYVNILVKFEERSPMISSKGSTTSSHTLSCGLFLTRNWFNFWSRNISTYRPQPKSVGGESRKRLHFLSGWAQPNPNPHTNTSDPTIEIAVSKSSNKSSHFAYHLWTPTNSTLSFRNSQAPT